MSRYLPQSIALCAVAWLLLLPACSSSTEHSGPQTLSSSTTAVASVAPTPTGVAELRRALSRAGLETHAVSSQSTAPQDAMFGAKAEPLTLLAGQQAIYVFRFATLNRAAQAAATVSPDGSQLQIGDGVAEVDWVAHPHFFRQGRLIALFVETPDGPVQGPTNEQVLEALRDVMGEQLAGG